MKIYCRILLVYAKIQEIISESEKEYIGEVEESDVQTPKEQILEERVEESRSNEVNVSGDVKEEDEEENDDIEAEKILDIDKEEKEADNDNDPNLYLLSKAQK